MSNLHVSGTTIRDASNTQIILRGTFDNTRYLNHPALSAANLASLAASGCNLLRFEGLTWGTFETASGIYNQTIIAQLDAMADKCQEAKIYFNPVFADFTGGDGTSIGGQGVTYPNWLIGVSGNSQTFETGFYDKTQTEYNTARSEFTAMLVYLATRYADNPYFLLSFENEPFNWGGSSPFNSASLSAKFAAVISDFYSAVDATDYSNIIIQPNPFCNYELTNPSIPTGANFVFDIHAYWVDTNSSYDTLAEWIGVVNQYGITPYVINSGMPIIVGEFAEVDGSYVGSQQSGFLTNTGYMVTYLNNQGIGSAWAYLGELYGYFDPIYSQADTTSLLGLIFDGSVSPTPPAAVIPLAVASSVLSMMRR